MRNEFETLDKLVRDGIITKDAADDIKEKTMSKTLKEQNIIMPTITEHMRKGKMQYTCMIPANMSKDGKRHQITGKTEDECVKKWTAAMYDVIENGKRVEPVTLSELMTEWMSKKKDIKKQTLAGYYSHYENHIKNAPFAKKKIKEIRLQDCKDIIAYLVNYREERKNGVVGLGYNTVRHIKSEISMALDYAVANEYINVNYMSTVRINQGLCDTSRARESRAWSDTELQTLHETAIREWEENKKYRYSAVLMAMTLTGCRAGEFCALEWKDFDAKRKTLNIDKTLSSYRDYDAGTHVQTLSTPKTADSVRRVHLTDEAVFWMKEIKRRQLECGIVSNYVTATRTGSRANQRDLNVRFEIFCRVAGVEYNPTHTCRRTYASVLYDGGVPVSEIAKDLGHKKTPTTMNAYYKPRAEKSIIDKKNSIFVTAVTASGKTQKVL